MFGEPDFASVIDRNIPWACSGCRYGDLLEGFGSLVQHPHGIGHGKPEIALGIKREE
jgi:hypothetical protein